MSSWPFPRMLAHRGGGTLAPENTLAAMRCGLQYGFRAVEFDVMLAQDGVPVVIHDSRLGRTVDGNADIASLTSAQLGTMDAGSWFDKTFIGEPVPTFEQVFSFCRVNGIWMNIEIKPSAGTAIETGQIVATMVQNWIAYDDPMPPLLSSFSFEAMEAAMRAAEAIPRGWLVDRIPSGWQQQLKRLNAVALHANQKHLTRTLVEDVKNHGVGVLCYTVNDPARAVTLFEWGVDAMCTDRLDLIGPHFDATYFP